MKKVTITDKDLYEQYKSENSKVEYCVWLENKHPQYVKSINDKLNQLAQLTMTSGHSEDLDRKKDQLFFKLRL